MIDQLPAGLLSRIFDSLPPDVTGDRDCASLAQTCRGCSLVFYSETRRQRSRDDLRESMVSSNRHCRKDQIPMETGDVVLRAICGPVAAEEYVPCIWHACCLAETITPRWIYFAGWRWKGFLESHIATATATMTWKT